MNGRYGLIVAEDRRVVGMGVDDNLQYAWTGFDEKEAFEIGVERCDFAGAELNKTKRHS